MKPRHIFRQIVAVAALAMTAPPAYADVLTYGPDSRPLSVRRHGVLSLAFSGAAVTPEFGEIDNLTFTYEGPRLTKVSDAAADVVYAGAADFDAGADRQEEYTYDADGNMLSDANKGITSIRYNAIGLPAEVTFSDGSAIVNRYGADGTLLQRVSREPSGLLSPLSPGAVPTVMTETVENHIGGLTFRKDALWRIETPVGYISSDCSAHYYIRDHQGNVRQVTDAGGNVEQDTHYYPYGMLMGESGDILATARAGRRPLVDNRNRRLFGSKEYLTAAGSNLLDFTARTYDPSILLFHTPDPLRDKYLSVHAYLYCGADPVNRIDPTGKRILFVNGHWSSIYGKLIGSEYSGVGYWDKNFATAASKYFHDYSVIRESYIDGSSMWGGDMSGEDRYNAGYNYAVENINTITSGMSEGECFNMVTHSEGAAFGAGVASALIDNGYRVAKILHLSADEGDEFSTPEQPYTIQIAYDKDWVTGNEIIEGTDLSGIVCKGNLSYFQVHGTTKNASVFQIARDLEGVIIQEHIGMVDGKFRSWKSHLPTKNGSEFYIINKQIISNYDGTDKR